MRMLRQQNNTPKALAQPTMDEYAYVYFHTNRGGVLHWINTRGISFPVGCIEAELVGLSA